MSECLLFDIRRKGLCTLESPGYQYVGISLENTRNMWWPNSSWWRMLMIPSIPSHSFEATRMSGWSQAILKVLLPNYHTGTHIPNLRANMCQPNPNKGNHNTTGWYWHWQSRKPSKASTVHQGTTSCALEMLNQERAQRSNIAGAHWGGWCKWHWIQGYLAPNIGQFMVLQLNKNCLFKMFSIRKAKHAAKMTLDHHIHLFFTCKIGWPTGIFHGE